MTKTLEYPRARVERRTLPQVSGLSYVVWSIALVAKPGDFYRVHPAYHVDMGVAMTVAANIVRTERAALTAPLKSVAFDPAAPAQALRDFEEERRKERQANMPKPVPTRCPDCMRRVRKASQKASEWPGTVAMTSKDGHCAACRKRRQTATIEAAEPKSPRQELVDAITPPAAQKISVAEPIEEEHVQPAVEVSAPPTPAEVEDLEPEESARGSASKMRTPPAKPRATRKRATPKAERPVCSTENCDDTVTNSRANGLCKTHHAEAKLLEPLTPQEEQAKKSAEAYAAARRRRGIPPEGRR